jgi:hypothetical protein
MNFNGTYSREFTHRKDLSFLMKSFSVDNVSGEATFGVSGESQTLELKFEQGKIKDFNNVYVGSYDPSSNLEIAGDISKDHYNLKIDGKNISRGIDKNDFKIEKFFINTTDCNLSTDLYIYGDLIDYTITAPSSITVGDTFTVSMSNSSADAKFYIYSVEIMGSQSPFYSVNPSYLKEIDSGQSIDFSITSSLSSGFGNHQLDLNIKTNIGTITKTISLLVNELKQSDVLIDLNEPFTSPEDLSFDTVNSNGERMFQYTSFVQGDQQSIENVSLEYASGNAGNYYQVTGVEITNTGSGYSGDANIIFDAGTGNDSRATGTVVMSGDSVSSVDIDYEGVYFDSYPTIIFSGDFIDPNDPNNDHAEGNPLIQSYEKTFTNTWDVCTGSYNDAGFSCFKENQLTGNQGEVQYDYANLGPGIYENPTSYAVGSDEVIFIKVTNKSFYDFDPMEAKLKIESKLADTQTYRTIEQVSITGANTKTTTTTTTTNTTAAPTTTSTTTTMGGGY